MHQSYGDGFLKEKKPGFGFKIFSVFPVLGGFIWIIRASPSKRRKWENPTARLIFGDPPVTMPPAPALGSTELAYEMAEVYELALLRDVRLTEFGEGSADPAVLSAITRLNDIDYTLFWWGEQEKMVGALKICLLFRVETGSYLSQFLLIGNDRAP
ncbi:MAG: hypothetical protein H0A75_02580 [Candidatus Methanofishera endochildressiae]|uniref:Uncharacterized protein n=1 Tax=Candidatus Methanofishera endochildressiae TaxID=2738884 RepID=A0A7Z0MNW3_9GAMM|nr:hypothetical protein [Candidatus Methanofishera endochildressiae]